MECRKKYKIYLKNDYNYKKRKRSLLTYLVVTMTQTGKIPAD